MRVTGFTIPVNDAGEGWEKVNHFLRAHRVLSVEKQFVADGPNSIWALCVTYLETARAADTAKKPKVDYREVLSESDFAVYARLRALRKELADKDGVPAYALFTNDQLAAMVQDRVLSPSGLEAIAGVGAARVEKYGAPFLEVLRSAGPVQCDKAAEDVRGGRD